jgi:TRAP-type C4-dicarboxylate transport system permease small subunit
MKAAYARAMDAVYLVCIVVSGLSLVVMTLAIPWGVFTRYVLNQGSAWPEPLSVLMMILFTFFGAAACYRANAHIAVTMVTDALPPVLRRTATILVDLLMALLSIFMVIWGAQLVHTTWYQVVGEFPFLSVGITYLPIPVGGMLTLLFIIEQVSIGLPGDDSIVHREPAEAR